MDFRLPLGDWVEAGVDWFVENAAGFFAVLRAIFLGLYDALDWLVSTPPAPVIIVVISLLALFARSWLFAIGTAAGLTLILLIDQWDNAMDTLALVLVAAFLAILISVPVGIAAAKSSVVSTIVRPILDFLQTMPAFVYLIPALLLFRVGVAPGIVATVIFAMAPGVRLTELGVRGVDSEVVEAGQAFGSSSGRILRQIQLPLALPTIMAGINQVIMLSLSMVVIAGLVGAGGLGGDIIAALNRLDTALGVEAGLSVVILAIVLDRLTSSFGQKRGLMTRIRERVALRSAAAGQQAAPPHADEADRGDDPARQDEPRATPVG